MKINLEDTIVAIATPPGQGAIGIVRLSGPESIRIADEVFHGRNLTRVKGHTVHYGKILDDDGRILDECLATIFRAPRSYTKEDLVEFSCHGSPYILQEVVRLFLSKGLRHAEPGEFTMRSFLNGQLDLTQAEAVADLIASDSEMSHQIAMKQMRGGMANEIKDLRQELIDFAALIELELDFSEEDVEFADREKLYNLVSNIHLTVTRLLESFELGNALKHGVQTVIAGKPNAGKSTLLNALLDEERAIVSDIPGTTRDTIEEVLNIGGIQFRLVDTAGIRITKDEIEKMGVERTFAQISRSAVVIYMFDITKVTPENLWEEVELFRRESPDLKDESKILFVANKMDLNPYARPEEYYKEGIINRNNLVTASAKNRMNIEYIKEKLHDMVMRDKSLADQTIVTNIRHRDALKKTKESLQAVLDGIREHISGDLLALDIRRALYFLGEISGEISADDLLDSIFGRFCIGK